VVNGSEDRLILAGGTVVTAEGSFRADVAVAGETIEAIGADLPRDGAEVVDVSGARVMPGFIDGHTHMDMPFGGTVTADDWDTGTAAAVAGGTTTIVDFSLQDPDDTLSAAVETWHGKAADKTHIDYGLHVAITNLTEEVKREIPALPGLGVATVKIFMAYKGTSLYTEDEDLFEALQIARAAGVLVLVHAENGDAIAKLQEQAIARGDVEPRWHGLTRPEAVEAEATNRAIRLAEVADAPLLVVHVSCLAALEEVRRAHARGRPVYAETCPQYLVFSDADLARPGFEGAKYVLSPPLRDPSNQGPLWHGLQTQDLQIFGSDHCSFNWRGQKEMGRDDFTLIPNGAPGVEERASVLWTHGVREGRITENLMVAVLATNQAKVHGMAGRKGVLAPGADADVVVWDPDLTITATQSNRHGNVDYTPYEGMTFHGGPAAVYVRGNLAYRDGEVLAPPGSGRFVERAFAQPAPGPAVR
jgi:dihydropyrimidinase